MFTGFICLWLMLANGMNTFCFCLNKEMGLCALPHRFKTLVCFYRRTERRGSWGQLGNGPVCLLFQRPAVHAFLEANGDKEKRDTR